MNRSSSLSSSKTTALKTAARQSLWIRSLSVGYRKRDVIQRMQLPAIPAGSLVAVIGPNAVGKSTLMKAMAGLLPYKGEVLFGSADLAAMTHAERTRRLGYLPQTLPQATTLVAYEVVYSACRAVCPEFSAARIENAIEEVFDALGIGDLALRRLTEMSGGQRQMVGLAQVLVREPQLMLLDEPTSALDLHWQLNVLETVRRVSRETGAIALVASHDINLALRFCDQLLVMSPAGTPALGPPLEVLTPAVLRAAYAVEGRIESCSLGYPIVLTDRALAAPH